MSGPYDRLYEDSRSDEDRHWLSRLYGLDLARIEADTSLMGAIELMANAHGYRDWSELAKTELLELLFHRLADAKHALPHTAKAVDAFFQEAGEDQS